MNKYTSEKTSDKNTMYSLKPMRKASISTRQHPNRNAPVLPFGTPLSKMRVEGEMVPAIKLEVDKATYDTFKRD